MSLPQKVHISETCTRDGLQNEKVILNAEQKMALINDLINAGFDFIDCGSFVRYDRVPQMASTPEVFRKIERRPGIAYRALIPNMKGLQLAHEAGCSVVGIGVSASRAHALANYNRTPEESVAVLEDIFKKGRDWGMDVRGGVQCAFGSPWDGLIPLDAIRSLVEKYVRMNVYHLSLSDTAGVGNPDQVYEYFFKLHEEYPEVIWSTHFHNTRGMAMANLIASLHAGVVEHSLSLAGLGGCPFIPNAAGNLSTEDVVHALHNMGIETGLNLDKLIDIGHMLEEILGHKGGSYILRAGKTSDLLTTFSRQE